jgi:hypothetical protein
MNIVDSIPTIEIETPPYNHHRFSKPYCGTIAFSTGANGEISWGEWIGNSKVGSDGLLIIKGMPGTVILEGQKDYLGSDSYTRYGEITADGSPHWLGTSKVAAYRAWQRIQSEGPLPAKSSIPAQAETSDIDPWEMEDQAPCPYQVPDCEPESPETGGMWSSTINATIAAGRRPLIPIQDNPDNSPVSETSQLKTAYSIPETLY